MAGRRQSVLITSVGLTKQFALLAFPFTHLTSPGNLCNLKLVDQKKLALIIVVLLSVVGAGALFFYGTNKLGKLPSGGREIVPPTYTSPTISQEIPTLTPERIEIISKLETHTVVIQNKAFSPENLTIKLHDQVEWQNKDNETCQIKGEGWGDVPIGPGESFTQAFETVGIFTYSCALHPELTGIVVVE